jgi:hypothetical protein
MTLLALGSLKAAPGTTTTAVVLASVWPQPDVVLIEADPDGGSLVTRFDLPADGLGLTSLAGAGRHRLSPGLVWEHTQTLPGGLRAVPASPAPAQAATAVSQLARTLAAELAGTPDVHGVVDCGRLGVASPARPIADAADVLLLVCRPRLEELRLVLLRLEERPPPTQVGLLLVGDGFSPRAVDRFFADRVAVRVVGSLPKDPRTAGALVDGGASLRTLRRSPLVRSARSIAERLHDLLAVEHARRAS